ncbi:SRPBCC family protein [Streptomyces sp. C8S0]|uniref:SRPBCC family protein n=1 Tax=Streptomyces sp. C8S0 TaxID=2585716 RepID=UPI001D03EA29|nr:SRPBCC domain-containing protein [Streptomyces sp. C8S0]
MDTVTLERHIAARPETVFGFFTDREKWLSWMGADGTFSFEPGGAYRTRVTGENVAAGRFLTVDPPKRLVFTWGWEAGPMRVPPGSTTVEITLEPTADGTLLRLVHTGLPPRRPAPHTLRAGSTTSTGSRPAPKATTPARTPGCSSPRAEPLLVAS